MDRNMIKSIFSILQVCVLCCLMFLYGSVNASAAVERLSVKGTFLVNEKGEKVVLKGVSMGWHNWWSRFYNASAVKTLKEQWNCTLIRAAYGSRARRGLSKQSGEGVEMCDGCCRCCYRQ